MLCSGCGERHLACLFVRSGKIIRRSRASPIAERSISSTPDRQNVPREGLLVIKREDKGAPDALRMKAHEVCEGLPSLSIDNTDWNDDVIANSGSRLCPRRTFAMIVKGRTGAKPGEISVVLSAGLNGRHENAASVMAEWEAPDTSDLSEMLQYLAQEWMDKS